MNIALLELWKVGLLQVAFYPGSFLCYIAWAAILIGAWIQWLLLKKEKAIWIKWVFTGILLAGLLAGEIGYQTVIGWDQLVPLLGYWLCLMLLLGNCASWIFYCFFKKRVS